MKERSSAQTTNPLWGGRFSVGAADLLREINASVRFDGRLAPQDIAGSVAHVRMLARQSIIDPDDAEAICIALETVGSEIASGEFVLSEDLEDVHMNVESRVTELIGARAGRMHTGRSRNDQVATDMKLWVRTETARLDELLRTLIKDLAAAAERYASTPVPGFTHLQAAQPVTLGHHLLAYAEMFIRDRDRLRAAFTRADVSPLGSAALAGTGYPIDSFATAADLGFRAPMRNSIDAVSDRDFSLDFLSAGSVLAIHLSRIGEEIVLWSTPQFGYAAIGDDMSAGSSIMPQKRNPDAAELIRAKSGRVVGSLVSLLMVLKSLPLAYSRDLQEDKEGVFDAADTLNVCVRTLIAVVRGMSFDESRMREDAVRGNTLATDLADWLVMEKSLPFREAHHVVGGAVKSLEERGLELHTAPLADVRALSPHLAELPEHVLTVQHALDRRRSFGGTAPSRVKVAAVETARINDELAPLVPSRERKSHE